MPQTRSIGSGWRKASSRPGTRGGGRWAWRRRSRPWRGASSARPRPSPAGRSRRGPGAGVGGDLRGVPPIRFMPRTSRKALSIDSPSTSGRLPRRWRRALLASVYAAMRGRTTTTSGHSRWAWPPPSPFGHPGLRLVARGQHDAGADDHRPPGQAGIVTLLDRREGESTSAWRIVAATCHEHMFSQTSACQLCRPSACSRRREEPRRAEAGAARPFRRPCPYGASPASDTTFGVPPSNEPLAT